MIDIITAIVALDPTTQVSVNGEDITWHDGNPNGITTEQITAKQAALVIQADADEIEKNNARQSGRDKLKALGLSDIEVDALT